MKHTSTSLWTTLVASFLNWNTANHTRKSRKNWSAHRPILYTPSLYIASYSFTPFCWDGLSPAPTDEILTCPFEDERFVFHFEASCRSVFIPALDTQARMKTERPTWDVGVDALRVMVFLKEQEHSRSRALPTSSAGLAFGAIVATRFLYIWLSTRTGEVWRSPERVWRTDHGFPAHIGCLPVGKFIPTWIVARSTSFYHYFSIRVRIESHGAAIIRITPKNVVHAEPPSENCTENALTKIARAINTINVHARTFLIFIMFSKVL